MQLKRRDMRFRISFPRENAVLLDCRWDQIARLVNSAMTVPHGNGIAERPCILSCRIVVPKWAPPCVFGAAIDVPHHTFSIWLPFSHLTWSVYAVALEMMERGDEIRWNSKEFGAEHARQSPLQASASDDAASRVRPLRPARRRAVATSWSRAKILGAGFLASRSG